MSFFNKLAQLCGNFSNKHLVKKCEGKEIEGKFDKSLKSFSCRLPTTIFFGEGEVEKSLAKALKEYDATRILLAYGGGSIKRSGLYGEVVKILRKFKFFFVDFGGITPNPTLKKVREGISVVRKNKLDFILSVGGGSCIDCVKAIARGVHSKVDIWKHFTDQTRVWNMEEGATEVPVKKAVPIGTILTLAATGSEMNAGCVITNEETMQKLACCDEKTKPKFSIMDPTHLYTLSKKQTIAGCLDIFNHILEDYFSWNTPFLIDRMGEAMMLTILKYLPKAIENPKDFEARSNIFWCGTVGLNGINQFGRDWTSPGWMVHKLQHEVGAKFHKHTHGIGLGIIQLAWLRKLIKDGEDKERTVEKACMLGKNLFGIKCCGGYTVENALKFVDELEKWQKKNGVPTRYSDTFLKDVYNEEACKELMEMYHMHWTEGKIGWGKFSREDILEVYKACI